MNAENVTLRKEAFGWFEFSVCVLPETIQ